MNTGICGLVQYANIKFNLNIFYYKRNNEIYKY